MVIQGMTNVFGYLLLLLFYVLTISKVIPGWVPTCDSVQSW